MDATEAFSAPGSGSGSGQVDIKQEMAKVTRMRIACPACGAFLWAPLQAIIPRGRHALRRERRESMRRGEKLSKLMGLSNYAKVRLDANRGRFFDRLWGAVAMVRSAFRLVMGRW